MGIAVHHPSELAVVKTSEYVEMDMAQGSTSPLAAHNVESIPAVVEARYDIHIPSKWGSGPRGHRGGTPL